MNRSYDDTAELCSYLKSHYPQFFCEQEFRILMVDELLAKQTGRCDPIEHAKDDIQSWIDGDEEIRQIADGNVNAYLEQAVNRIVNDHAADILVNRCPKCDRIARTPVAQMCTWCGHDWH